MGEKYNLIFEGKIAPGFNKREVHQKISKLLKIPEAQQDDFFSGRQIELKKDLTMDQALRLKQQLANHGLELLMVSAAFSGLSLAVEKPSVPGAFSTKQNNLQKSEPNEDVQKRREQYRAEYDQMVQAKSDKHDKNPHKPPSPFGFSFEGRYGRMSYFNAILIWGVGLLGLAIVAVLFLGLTKDSEATGIGLLVGTLSLLHSFCTYRIAVLRAHDLNLSGWLCLLLFVPLISFIFSVCLLFVRGTDGENGYGHEPDQGSLNVIILIAVIVLLVMLFC